MRRSLIILALVFLLAGCPKDEGTSGDAVGAAGVETTNGALYVDGGENGSKDAAVIPEPATLALFSLGAAGFAALKLKRRKKS